MPAQKVTHVTGVTSPPPELVQAELEQLLASDCFQRAESLSSFLRFVVEKSLAGEGEHLKARMIAIEALGRDSSFRSKTDPIVRIQASRLRRVLEDHYATLDGTPEVRIEIPKGSYQPVFQWASLPKGAEESVDEPLSLHQESGEPVVAVLPFSVLGSERELDYIGIGLTQEIVSLLTQFQELTVIAAPFPSSEDPTSSISELRQHGVQFVLSGTLTKSAETLVVRVQLIAASSREVIWTDKIKRDLTAAQLLDLEEEIAEHVTNTIADNYGVIPRALALRCEANRTDNLSVYEAVLRFRHYQCISTDELRRDAIEALQTAIQVDPKHALSWAMLSEAVCDAYGLRIDCSEDVLVEAKELARRATALNPECQHAHWSMAYVSFHARERERFYQQAERTIELNTNNGYLVGISAWAMALYGEWNRGLPILNRIVGKNPYYPKWFQLAPYLNHYRQGEYEAALHCANLFNIPTLAWDPILRASALGQLGRHQEAKAAINELHSHFPRAAADPRHYLRGYIPQEELVEQVAQGLNMGEQGS